MDLSKCVMNSIPGEGMSHTKTCGEEHRVAGGKARVLGRGQVMEGLVIYLMHLEPHPAVQKKSWTPVEKYW